MNREKNKDRKKNLTDLFKALDHYNISDLTANHASVLSETGKSFFINQHQHLFNEINPSNLVEVDLTRPSLDSLKKVNKAGYIIHKYLHLSKSKPKYILHTHSHNAVAISCLKKGFDTELNQSSMRFFGTVKYFPYKGMVIDDKEGKSLASITDEKTNLIVLRNHGVIVLAQTVEELFHLTFHFEKCSSIQLMLIQTTEKDITRVKKRISLITSKQHKSFGPVGKMSWKAVKRIISK